MGKVKQIVILGVVVTVLSGFLHFVGKSHINIPIAGSFAAYKETPNYYKIEDKHIATTENVKECMKYMKDLYARLKNVKTHEAIRILDEGIEFFKGKSAYVAVERLEKLKQELK